MHDINIIQKNDKEKSKDIMKITKKGFKNKPEIVTEICRTKKKL